MKTLEEENKHLMRLLKQQERETDTYRDLAKAELYCTESAEQLVDFWHKRAKKTEIAWAIAIVGLCLIGLMVL